MGENNVNHGLIFISTKEWEKSGTHNYANHSIEKPQTLNSVKIGLQTFNIL